MNDLTMEDIKRIKREIPPVDFTEQEGITTQRKGRVCRARSTNAEFCPDTPTIVAFPEKFPLEKLRGELVEGVIFAKNLKNGSLWMEFEYDNNINYVIIHPEWIIK